MKKVKWVLCMLVLVINASAQKVKIENSILWKISGNGLARPSYILLTGPSCDESLKIADKVKTVLGDVTTIAVEYDLYDKKDAAKLSANNVAINDSQKLRSNLSGEEYLQFSNFLKGVGYPEPALKVFEKYKINMMYFLLKMSAGTCGAQGQLLVYENEMRPLAKKSNLEFTVLQSVDEVIEGLNVLPGAYWKKNIKYFLDNEENVKQTLKNEAVLYKAEKLNDLQKLYNNNSYYKLQYELPLLNNKIVTLATKIEQQALHAPALMSIDISNVLFTTASVFEQLKNKGYEVTAVQ